MWRNSIRWVMAGVIALLILRLFGKKSQPAPAVAEVTQDQPAVLEKADAVAQELKREKAGSPAVEPMPAPHPSLLGTDVNGGIRTDREGRIIFHRDVRRLFDYYLSLLGRMQVDEIRALLRQHLAASSSRDVLDQALALFDKYVGLIDAETKMAEEWTQRDLNAASQVATVLDERRHLRREHLGDELAEAFFADQENYEAYQLERLKIGTNSNLTEEQKAAALAEAENILTPEQREIRKQTFAWLDIKKVARQPIESLDAESADAIRQRFGEAALDRLAAVEQERHSWEQKRQDYLAEKTRLQARTDLTDDERKARLLEYAQAHLNSSELRRMQALDSDQAAL